MEIYRQPANRFVASFVGDVNVLHGRLERIDGATAIVALGSALITVPANTLAGAVPGSMIDLFVRPEDLSVAEGSASTALHGIVATHIYQGSHVDLHVEVPEAASGRVHLRVPGQDAMRRWLPGTQIGIAFAKDNAIAFRQNCCAVRG